MRDNNYRLILYIDSDLSVIKLDSLGNFFGSEKFKIDALDGDANKEARVTLLSNDGKIYELIKYKEGRKNTKKEDVK